MIHFLHDTREFMTFSHTQNFDLETVISISMSILFFIFVLLFQVLSLTDFSSFSTTTKKGLTASNKNFTVLKLSFVLLNFNENKTNVKVFEFSRQKICKRNFGYFWRENSNAFFHRNNFNAKIK